MIVVPAIDLLGGRVVRLERGRAETAVVFDQDPVARAGRFEAEGAKRIHVVDLDAALGGESQLRTIERIAAAVSIPIEVGGGLGDLPLAARLKGAGVDRLIFGTAAVEAPALVSEAIRRWPTAVAVAIDARDGWVQTRGWTKKSSERADALARRVVTWGVTRLQYTDTARDGTLEGPNLDTTRALAREAGVRVTASGGVSSLDDIRAVSRLETDGVDEVIVGRALYEDRFTIREARVAAGEADAG